VLGLKTKDYDMTILREVTHEKHMAVENLPFIQYLLHGNITESHYVIYLAEMLTIYQHLENLSQQAGLFDGLSQLPRALRMQQDLDELAPDYKITQSASTTAYLEHLNSLFHSPQKNQLFSHVYVRHMGDLYGGKLIARRVPGSGRWYEFENRAELVKKFNERITADLAEEALVAFDHYSNIFQDLWTRIK
jgi:heme oxygenase